jgi:Trypsin-like peptidase domain
MPILKASVQSLLIQMRFNGKVLSTGTAFVAEHSNGYLLVTNRHNVTGRRQDDNRPLSSTGGIPNEVEILHNQAGNLGSWVSRVEPLVDNVGNPLWHEHPVLGPRADFVTLPLTQLNDVDLFPHSLGFGDPAIHCIPADVVSVIGFPFGLTGGGCLALWVTGFIASEPSINFNNMPIFLIDCRSRPGQSGSAVIANRNGGLVTLDDGSSAEFNGPVSRFLGIYSGRINEQSDLGIVWKAQAIQELINSI